VGPERLIVLAMLTLAACAKPAPPATAPPSVVVPRHAQIVRAATTAERRAVFEKFQAKNDGPWKLLRLDADVDPFRLFLRRAARTDAAGPEQDFEPRDAIADAVAFVSTNADVLGLSAPEIAVLDASAVALVHEDAPTPEGRYVVRLVGRIPMRGFESFDALASILDLSVYVDRDRKVRLFTNDSKIPPRITLDTRPLLDPDDPSLLKNVVGRPCFTEQRGTQAGSVREVKYVPAGVVNVDDVVARTLTIRISHGPLDAYVAYMLAYAVFVEKEGSRWIFVVDADTGAVLEDPAPLVLRHPEREL
jgi:hypothetical protein